MIIVTIVIVFSGVPVVYLSISLSGPQGSNGNRQRTESRKKLQRDHGVVEVVEEVVGLESDRTFFHVTHTFVFWLRRWGRNGTGPGKVGRLGGKGIVTLPLL